MSKKFISFFSIIFFIALLLNLQPILADNSQDKDKELPEQDGIYDVPGHPELKVKVFVHKAKPAKPGQPAPAPLLMCNLQDPNSDAFVASTTWHLPSNWIYRLNPSSVPASVGSKNLVQIADRAFNQWKGAISKVTVIKGMDTSINRAANDKQNIIAWGKTSASALAITYTWYYPATGLVAEVDTIMNQKYFWKWSDPADWSAGGTTCAYTESYDAQNILTHELGHWYGLDDEYAKNYQDNTMYGYGSKGETKKDTLTNGDIIGVTSIYQ